MVGFLDESSPQTTANTQRLLSFDKPIIHKNTTKLRSNTFGFYALNGTSVIDFKEHSKKEDVCDFLRSIRSANPDYEIVIILDNFRSHRAKETILCAIECDVQLAFLPPYSPDLNPIEFIWKSIKRVVSSSFIKDVNHMRDLIRESFMTYSSHMTFAKRWVEVFLKDRNISLKS
ncbi:MAG: IS630 family transposase [Methanotrichaceae archaeon]|nr:IS630 family transposase [Methanotrichaceae archaeon]